MAVNVCTVTDATFDSFVRDGVALVDFWAPWCGPCQMQGPILEELAGRVGAKASVGKLNIDEGQAVAGRLGVQSIPTLVLFRDGHEVERFVGVQQADALQQAIENATGQVESGHGAGGCAGCGGCG